MKITIESTTQVVKVNGVDCRVWEGTTERGVSVYALIPRVAAKAGDDCSEFEAELKEHAAPSADAFAVFPLRMVI